MSASCTSRVRLEVMTTTGGRLARIVPISGIVIWKSESSSSRKLSNSSSARSISSISRTGTPLVLLDGLQQRPRHQELAAVEVALHLGPSRAAGLQHAEVEDLPGVGPLVDRVVDVQPLVALEPDQPRAEQARQHFGDLGLADPGFALQKERLAELQRQEDHGCQAMVGEVALVEQAVLDFVDRVEQLKNLSGVWT